MRRLVIVSVGVLLIVAIVGSVLVHQVHKASKTFHLVAPSALSASDKSQITAVIRRRSQIALLGSAKVTYSGKKINVFLPKSRSREESLAILVPNGTATINPITRISTTNDPGTNPSTEGRYFYQLQAPVIKGNEIVDAASLGFDGTKASQTDIQGLTITLTDVGEAACHLLGATEAADYADPNGGNQSAVVVDGIVVASETVNCDGDDNGISHDTMQYTESFDSQNELVRTAALVGGGAYPRNVVLTVS